MNEELEEFLLHFVEYLNQVGERGFAVVVEGKRDKQALERLGVHVPILTKASCGSMGTLLEQLLHYRGFIPLFDLDSEGQRLTRQLCGLASKRGIRAELGPRSMLLDRAKHLPATIQGLQRLGPQGRL